MFADGLLDGHLGGLMPMLQNLLFCTPQMTVAGPW
jgi:hypothetical protein